MKKYLFFALLVTLTTHVNGQQLFSVNKIQIETLTKKHLCSISNEDVDPLYIRIDHSKTKGVLLLVEITDIDANGKKLDDAEIYVKSLQSGITNAYLPLIPNCTKDKMSVSFKFVVKDNNSKTLQSGTYSSAMTIKSANK
jgi:hypothetical protein